MNVGFPDAGAPSSRNSTPVQRRDHGACGAHHTGHLLQRFVEPIDQERTRWTVIDERDAGRGADVVFHVDGARQLDLQAQKP